MRLIQLLRRLEKLAAERPGRNPEVLFISLQSHYGIADAAYGEGSQKEIVLIASDEPEV